MTAESRPWYERAFGAHYLSVYVHRDDEAAEAEASFAAGALGLVRGARVLDLACGAGRHARALLRRELRVVALDLSGALLAAARDRDPGGRVPLYVRGEMRRLPFSSGFAAVTLFFTSFGYFETEDEDLSVLEEAARVLEPSGRLLLDTANREAVMTGLVPESEERRGGLLLRQERRLSSDERRVLKTVRIERAGEPPLVYTESVRLYAPEEVEALVARAGFRVSGRYGDLAGSPHGRSSPRCVVTGVRRC